MRLIPAATLALVLLAAGCSHRSPEPETTTAPASPSPGVSAPVNAPTASPYHYVVVPPPPAPGMPAILEIDMLEQTIHAGAPYSVRVRTSPDVTAINVSSMGQTYGMQAAAPGLFATDGQVPSGIPFFLLNRSYGVTVTALTADRRSTTVTVDLRLER